MVMAFILVICLIFVMLLFILFLCILLVKGYIYFDMRAVEEYVIYIGVQPSGKIDIALTETYIIG